MFCFDLPPSPRVIFVLSQLKIINLDSVFRKYTRFGLIHLYQTTSNVKTPCTPLRKLQYIWKAQLKHLYLTLRIAKLGSYNPSPLRMLLFLDLRWEYRIQYGANEPLYVTSSYSTWIFCRGVSYFATDCPCGVWCRGLTTCLMHVDPPFGNRILNNSWAIGLT